MCHPRWRVFQVNLGALAALAPVPCISLDSRVLFTALWGQKTAEGHTSVCNTGAGIRDRKASNQTVNSLRLLRRSKSSVGNMMPIVIVSLVVVLAGVAIFLARRGTRPNESVTFGR